jgi:hypothetical protein
MPLVSMAALFTLLAILEPFWHQQRSSCWAIAAHAIREVINARLRENGAGIGPSNSSLDLEGIGSYLVWSLHSAIHCIPDMHYVLALSLSYALCPSGFLAMSAIVRFFARLVQPLLTSTLFAALTIGRDFCRANAAASLCCFRPKPLRRADCCCAG